MKKQHVFIASMLTSILFSSCIKTYTCKCEPIGTNTQAAFEIELKSTKKAAKEGCESQYPSSSDSWKCDLQ